MARRNSRRSGDSFRDRNFLAVSAFIALAIVAGGGGTPAPLPELVVQLGALALAFYVLAIAGDRLKTTRSVWVLAAAMLVLPALQLIPLPPPVWQAMPGREAAGQSLALIGAEDSWRSWSLAPHRTFASLLALVPPAVVLLAVANLTPALRQRLLPVIAALASIAAIFGLIAWVGGWSLYGGGHRNWVTGFNANRNAAADLFLIGLAALVAVQSDASMRRPIYWLAAPVLLLAIVLTGSRTGIALLLAGGAIGALILLRHNPRIGGAAIAGVVAAGLATWAFASSRLAPVIARFDATGDARQSLWQDTWYAISQFWPMGSGMGTFALVFPASERLEAVDESWPNRAHNDYLELALEAGLPGLLWLAACVALALWIMLRGWRSGAVPWPMLMFAGATLAIIALHSLVDYPLRTLSLACLAALAVGLCAPPGTGPGETDSRDGT